MVFYLLWNKRKKLAIFFILWASIISISQVYVGVHFPLDIIAGALLGLVVASIVFLLFKKLNTIIYINE
jgi:undecaprenyl-diphosphatase